MNRRSQISRVLIRIGIVIELLVLGGCSPGCTNNSLPTATPSFTLAFRGTDGNLHVRWSTDGQTWRDPDSFPSPVAADHGPGFSGIPTGLAQTLVLHRGTTLFRMSSIGPAVWGSDPPALLQTGVTVNSPIAVEFTGSGSFLFAHRTGNSGVLRAWDGTATTTNVVTPAGTMTSLCAPDTLSGPIGPSVIQVAGKILVAFCQLDNSGNESIQLLPGTLASNGAATFATQVPFVSTRPGFDAPFPKIYALAHDGTNFLLATVAKESTQSAPLTTFGLMIHSSPDGQNWTFVTLTSKNSGINRSARNAPLGLAAMPAHGTTPTVIQAAQFAGAAASPTLWEFNGTSWIDRTSANPFGGASLDGLVGFAFRVNGTP
jgi:hypothetical protein